MISLKQLRYLDAIARHGHFGRAAHACNVTQPALSMQLQELERDLGVRLVERRRRGIALTAAGQDIARRAARILSEVSDIQDLARQIGTILSAPLRLGVIPTLAPYVLPTLLPLLRDRHPRLELRVRETQTHHLLAELAQCKLDAVLLALPVNDPDFATLHIHDDPFWLALPPGRRMRGPVQATPELFREERLLLLEEGHCLRDQALQLCSMTTLDSLDLFGASSLSTIVQMVANGMGLTLLPEISLAVEARAGGVEVIGFAEPIPKRSIGLCWRKTSPREPDFAALAKLTGEALGLGRQRWQARLGARTEPAPARRRNPRDGAGCRGTLEPEQNG